MLHLFGPFSLRTRTLFTSMMIGSLLARLVPPPLLSSMAGNVVMVDDKTCRKIKMKCNLFVMLYLFLYFIMKKGLT